MRQQKDDMKERIVAYEKELQETKDKLLKQELNNKLLKEQLRSKMLTLAKSLRQQTLGSTTNMS